MRASSLAPAVATADKILDVAEGLVQTHGFNGFSYADVAAELNITKASLHYHFATKGDLGLSLIRRYQAVFVDALSALDRKTTSPVEKLRGYVKLYVHVLKQKRMCLCAMLAAEQATLPKAMQDGVRAFFDANESWLASVFEAGKAEHVLNLSGTARETARLFLGALEGSMLVARSYDAVAVARFESAADLLVGALCTRSAKRGSRKK